MESQPTIDTQVPPHPAPVPLVRAAQYVRMSTEHQQYSTKNQSDVIREYASKRGYEIVRTYADAGKSGLRILGREALQQLIRDVQDGSPGFDVILVYDVSRWGRFQDSDESAYYEYVCKRAGIAVAYCAEQFENDGSPTSTIIKSVKRAMAGEYSRDLSAKVFKGQCKLIELGFRQGGTAGYGLRRMLVDVHGQPKGVLGRGEHKSLQTDRVVLVPGPDEEVAVVRSIFQSFVTEGLHERQIAERLNARGVPSETRRPWSHAQVHEILTNEKYIGNNVYNRISFKLKRKRVVNPPEMWVRRDSVFTPVIDPESFFMAKGMVLERQRRVSDEEMLNRLAELYRRHAKLTARIIDEGDGTLTSCAYQGRFGSLLQAYARVGYRPARDYTFVEINRRLRQLYPGVVDDAVGQLRGVGASVDREAGSDRLLINGEYTAAIVITRCRRTRAGDLRWRIDLAREAAPDLTVLVRMDTANGAPSDYYLLPLIDLGRARLRLEQHNAIELDAYRFESLSYFVDLAARARIEVAA
jgi:DNA invertase Pin-like site-specific DNA recombinase